MNFIKKLYGIFVQRPLQRFNVDNRAQKLFDDEKIRPPPKHVNDEDLLKKIKNDEEYIKSLEKKDDNLLKNVNKISIKSTEPDFKEMPKGKNLPNFRGTTDYPLWGYIEPEKIPDGKLTISMFVKILDMKYTEKKSLEDIYAEFPLISQEDIQNILYFYKPFLNSVQNNENAKKLAEKRKLLYNSSNKESS